jgi:exosortase A-associated hydrolase 1
MSAERHAFSFACGGHWLYGVLDLPPAPPTRGVLFIVGGPQYRAGSHRQFALLARELAVQGFAAMRFDYRGMGDSEGAMRNFEGVDEDLRCAIDAFFEVVPGLTEVVLWGLCDAASAAALYAADDARVAGLVLLNPWVRTEAGEARATLKHYYRARLLQPGLWRKIWRGQFNYRAAVGSLRRLLASAGAADRITTKPDSLPSRMADGLARFEGELLVLLSGADLTAQEFSDLASTDPTWVRILSDSRATSRTLPKADHTCSRRSWHDQLARHTADWLRSW